MFDTHPRFLFPNLLPELISPYTLLLLRVPRHILGIPPRRAGPRQIGLRPAPGTVSIFYALHARGVEEVSDRIEVGVL